MKYLPYKPSSESLYNIGREYFGFKLNKKTRTPQALARCLKKVYQAEPEMIGTMDCVIHCEEYDWMTSGQTTYFFEDSTLANAVAQGSYKVTDMTPFINKDETFKLMIPTDMQFGGRQAGSSLLVSLSYKAINRNPMFAQFFTAMGLPVPRISNRDLPEDKVVSVVYQQGLNKIEYCRVCFPTEYLSKALSADSYQEYADYVEEHNSFDYFRGAILDMPEKEYQFDLIRIVAGFLSYRAALPERIKPGLPSSLSHGNSTSFAKDATNHTLKYPKGERERL